MISSRRSLIPLCIAAAAAVAPATAAAASNAYLSFGPIKAPHGYKLSGTIGKNFPGAPRDVTLDVSRTAGGQTQSYGYNGFTKGFKFKSSGSLASANVKAAMGPDGSLSLSFRGAGRVKKTTKSAGCTGATFSSKKGSVTGALTFKTGTPFFGNIKSHKAKASLTKFSGTLHCPSVDTFAETLDGSGGTAGDLLSAMRSGTSNTIRAGYITVGGTPFTNVLADITQGGNSAFTVQPDLSGAHIAVSGPFMSGTSAFTQTSKCNAQYVYGSVTGTISAHFDVGGAHSYGSDGQGTLVKDFGQCASGTGPPTSQAMTVQPGCGQDDPSTPAISCSDGTTGGTPPYTYKWDFGDGTSDTSANPSHTYAAAGTYTITETVTDSTGTVKSGSTTVTVTSS